MHTAMVKLSTHKNEKKADYFGGGRGGDTSMAGMSIAISGVLNISKTGHTMR